MKSFRSCLGSLGDSGLDVTAVEAGEGNGTPLQYSFLENPRDGGAWWAAVYGAAQSRTRLKRLSSSISSSSGGGRLPRCLLNGVHGQRAHTGLLKKDLGQIPWEGWNSPPHYYTRMRDFTFSEEGCDSDCCCRCRFASSGPSREEQWGPFFI